MRKPRQNSEVARLEQQIRSTDMWATAHPGPIADAAKPRLQPMILRIDAALVARAATAKIEEAAFAEVQAASEKCDQIVASVHDDLYGLVGRENSNEFMMHVFPDGMGFYVDAAPEDKPEMLQVLQTQIGTCQAPQLTDETRQAWVAAIEEPQKALGAAVEKYRPTLPPKRLAEATYRSEVRGGVVQLRMLKRELQNLGVPKAKLAEIVIYAPRTRRKSDKPTDSTPPVNTPKAG